MVSAKLISAIHLGDIDSVKKILEIESEITNINSPHDKGCTALHHAITYGSIAICQLLLARGASVIDQNNAGQTPYDIAIDNCRKTPTAMDMVGLCKLIRDQWLTNTNSAAKRTDEEMRIWKNENLSHMIDLFFSEYHSPVESWVFFCFLFILVILFCDYSTSAGFFYITSSRGLQGVNNMLRENVL